MGRTTSQGACGSSPLTRGKRAISGCVARMVLAHPRSRGENCQRSGWSFRSSGSSPLTRGKLQGGDPVRLLTRLIPAHARKTLTPGSCPSDTSAHPRSRGENARYVSPQASSDGSSPLTRGKPSRRKTPTLNTGLIPAHAGKTVASWRIRQAARAHPRSHGENDPFLLGKRPGAGSSPLTRGKHQRRRNPRARRRLIPAHAGKTNEFKALSMLVSAHPRSRGENLASLL